MPHAAKLIALAALLALAALPTAAGAAPYCPSRAHQRPAPVPAALQARVAKAFDIAPAALRDAAYVRCVGPTLMGCYVGANLVCGKADTRRQLPGARAWCREHPGASFIPLAATGHATIYAWSCQGTRAVAGKIVQPVDARGYIKGNWRKVR